MFVTPRPVQGYSFSRCTRNDMSTSEPTAGPPKIVSPDQGDGDGNTQERGVGRVVHVEPPVAYDGAAKVGVRTHRAAVFVRLAGPRPETRRLHRKGVHADAEIVLPGNEQGLRFGEHPVRDEDRPRLSHCECRAQCVAGVARKGNQVRGDGSGAGRRRRTPAAARVVGLCEDGWCQKSGTDHSSQDRDTHDRPPFLHYGQLRLRVRRWSTNGGRARVFSTSLSPAVLSSRNRNRTPAPWSWWLWSKSSCS